MHEIIHSYVTLIYDVEKQIDIDVAVEAQQQWFSHIAPKVPSYGSCMIEFLIEWSQRAL